MSAHEEILQLKKQNDLLKAEVYTLQKWAHIPINSPFAVFQVDFLGNILIANTPAKNILAQWKEIATRPLPDYFRILSSKYKKKDTSSWLIVHPGKIEYQILITPDQQNGIFDIYIRDYIRKNDSKKQLLLANSRLYSLLSNMQFGALLGDENDNVLVVNELFCKIFQINLAPEAIVGLDCNMAADSFKKLFVNPEEFINKINIIKKNKTACNGVVFEMVSGTILECDYIPIFIKGQFSGNMWQYKDITKKEIESRNLFRSEEKYRTLIENMNLGLLEVDNNDIILFTNYSFQLMTGYSQAELLGKSASELLMDDETKKIIVAKNQLRQQGVLDVYEIPCKRKDGSLLWLLISGAPKYGNGGKTIGSIGIHLDITQRKVLEAELERARNAAEEASKTRELFMATMSHEIRTPMNAVIGMQKLLEKTKLDERQSRYVEAIGTSSVSLLTLLNDVLDFTKMNAGKIQLIYTLFDIRETVRSIRNILEFKADEKGISLEIIIDPKVPKYVLGDQNRIYQILLNLIGNGIKFTSNGYVHLYLKQQENDNIQFIVVDTGIGMSAESGKKVFVAFTQADSQTQAKYGGTGLGLSIAKELVDLMGGNIELESSLGVGSKFWFTLNLPGGIIQDKTTLQNPESIKRLDGKVILVVEDNEINRLLINTVLESYGASVRLAFNGLEALQSVEEHTPDAILMDLQMPVMGGLEASRKLREKHYKGPIFALTANIYAEDKARCLAVGMNELIAKPFDENLLIQELYNWIGILKA